MALYYVVPAVEAEEGGLTAALPAEVAWVGQPRDGTYLVKTLVQIDGGQPLDEAALVAECQARGLSLAEVRHVWAIGGET